jgi:hypothetical protein
MKKRTKNISVFMRGSSTEVLDHANICSGQK